MTNYNAWERRAASLDQEVEEEEQRAKAENDVALGLQDGPQGPPTQRAREQRGEMGNHSESRRNFIAEQRSRELVLGHTGTTEPIVLSAEEASGRAVRLQDSRDVTYEIPEGVQVLKLFVERCQGVSVRVRQTLLTSTMEISFCSDVEVRADCPINTVQCDECASGPVRVLFAEPEHVGIFFHQNSPALEVAVDGEDPTAIGVAEPRQFVTRVTPEGGFTSEEVVRGEKDFPLNGALEGPPASRGPLLEPEAEAQPDVEERRSQAEAKRGEGNSAFKVNDFLQAGVFYTEAIGLCPDLHLAWANRAQCFLQTGQPEKALEDATRCTELAPDYAKGWFRKGIALHSLRRYGEAIPALAQAETLDPKNKQIPDAVKMAQLMCRKHGYDGSK